VRELNISQYLPKSRIVNFTDIALDAENVLTITDIRDGDLPEELRKYAGAPHLYIVSKGQEKQVVEILKRLREIRSSCYPYGLFVAGGDYSEINAAGLDIIPLESRSPTDVAAKIEDYLQTRFIFDKRQLAIKNSSPLPKKVDVLIIGAGITGLYAAMRLAEKQISFAVVEERDIIGGIWSKFANTTSLVNTSEGAYRLLEKDFRSNSDHSSTREILEDLRHIAGTHSDQLFTGTKATYFRRTENGYETQVAVGTETTIVSSKGLILAINDRVGTPRKIEWPSQETFRGEIRSGTSDDTQGIHWKDKKVVVVGMGAFAVENVRTALEHGAKEVTVLCRRHGTICPKIIDYLNFATPYDENFQHDKKSNIRNMMLWKKLYDLAGATAPECWMGKIKHEGHTISVSDIWFIGHHLEVLKTVTGSVSSLYEDGVIVDDGQKIEADLIVNCVGFHRMSPVVKEMCDYKEMYNNNYIDKDLMYLADAYIDDDVFNSFFGSSVLEMTKFYMNIYLEFFDSPEFEAMTQVPGIEKILIDDRRWSHYITGAEAIIGRYRQFYEFAVQQINKRTENFLEAHDLEVYIAQNKREWLETHRRISGRELSEDECLPYVFEKLLEK